MLIPFTFVVQVLGIKVETKVQCVGAQCGLCLFSLLGAGLAVSFRDRSQGDRPRGSLLPVRGQSFPEPGPTVRGASAPLAARTGTRELEPRPGPGWWVDGRVAF